MGVGSWKLTSIFVCALGVRLLHVWQMRATPFFDALMGDARAYDAWAQRLAAGDWIGRDVFYQAPLYPYFLGLVYSIFGRDLLVVRIVQAIVGACSCVLVAYAASRLFSRPFDRTQGKGAGLVAGLLLAFYAPAIFFDGLIQKSVLDVFFVSALIALIATIASVNHRGFAADTENTETNSSGKRHHPGRTQRTAREKSNLRGLRVDLFSVVLIGIVAGCLALTRENALILVALLAVWIWWEQAPHAARFARLALFAAGVGLVLVPVAVRNYAVSGSFYLTTAQFGPNFYIGNHAGADGTYSSLRFGRGSPEYEQMDATELAQQALGRALTPDDVSSYWTSRALDFIASHPAEWLRLIGRKAALLVNAREMLDTESQESYAEWSLVLRVLGPIMHFGTLVPLAVLGAIAAWPLRSRLWVLYALVALYAASVTLFYVFARYRYPLVPLVALFASAALAEGSRFGRVWAAMRVPQLAAVAAVVVITAIVSNWPLLSPDLMRAITETNLGTALAENSRLQDAEAHYRRAIRIQADYAPAYNNLGVVLRAQGRLDEAIRTYEDGLQVRREYPTLHANLAKASYDAGTERLEQGRLNEAVRALEIALREQPQYAEAHNNLGIALGSQGNLDAAIAEFEEALRLKPGYQEAIRNLTLARRAAASQNSELKTQK